MKPKPKKPKKSAAKTAKPKATIRKPIQESKPARISARKKKPAKPARPARTETPASVKTSAKVTSERQVSLRQRAIDIPPILLEGDASIAPTAQPSGPGERYALGPVPPAEHVPAVSNLGDLPESY